MQMYQDNLKKLEGSDKTAAARYEKFYRRHKMSIGLF